MSEFMLINDIHLNDRAPASCTETYLDDLFDLLYRASASAAARGCAAIILAGDVFDNKIPARTSHGTIMRVIDWALSCSCPVYVVPGNHDLSHDRIDSLREHQPLGVLIASGVIRWLDGWLIDEWGDFDGDHCVYGVPWLSIFDDASVSDALADYRTKLLQAQLRTRHFLVVTHAPLYPPGKELPYENYPAEAWAKAMLGIGTVHYGHVHDPHGIYTVRGVTFSNPGALSRGSLTENNLNRVPAVAIWDSATGTIIHQELPAKPASEVFKLAQAAEKKAAQLDLSNFLDHVRATRLDISSTDAVIDHVRSTCDDQALVKLIARLLQDVS